MQAYPIQLGVTEKGDILLAQTDGDQEHVITISSDQVEQLISALRTAVEVLPSQDESIAQRDAEANAGS